MESTIFNVQDVFSEKSQYWDNKGENILHIKGESERLLNCYQPMYIHLLMFWK